MNIKCLRWQDIYQQFPKVYRQDFKYNVDLTEILTELAPHIVTPISTHDLEWIINELQNSDNLNNTEQKIKKMYNLNISQLHGIKKCYIPSTNTEDFRSVILNKVLEPFIRIIFPKVKESEIAPIANVFFPAIKEGYILDKNQWTNGHPVISSELLSRVLYTCYRDIYKEANSHPAWLYGSSLNECLSYWRENQYLYESNNNLPISNKMAAGIYQMFGTCNKKMDTFSDNEWDEIFSGTDVKLEHSSVPEEVRNKQWEDELQLIEIERQPMIKKIA